MPGDAFYSSMAWRAARALCRRLAGNKCAVCGADCRKLHTGRVDHVIPRSKAPALALMQHNLRLLCVSCDAKRHREKGLGDKRVQAAEVGLDGWPVDE